jgi:recombination protein RecR
MLPPTITSLMSELGKLPGIGPRSAERLALHLLQSPLDSVQSLAQTILQARNTILNCTLCGALSETQICLLCQNPRRDQTLVCVVERPVDIINLEKSNVYHGLYHVLGGRISPINGVGPDDLRISALEKRVSEGVIREVIVALGSDVEGDATGYYLAKVLAEKKIKVTRLAHGLPVGSSLEYADELTLGRAIQGRQSIND